jgi:hypothetical protein
MGSATPKKRMPVPMPAPNSIENHENLVNSGFSPSFPKVICPYGEIIMSKVKIITIVTIHIK